MIPLALEKFRGLQDRLNAGKSQTPELRRFHQLGVEDADINPDFALDVGRVCDFREPVNSDSC